MSISEMSTIIAVVERGEIGKRAAKTIAQYGAPHISVREVPIPFKLEVMYENPPDFINTIDFAGTNIVIAYSYHIDITQFLIAKARDEGVIAFMLPGSDPAYRKEGARRRTMELAGSMTIIAPRVSCGGIPQISNIHIQRLRSSFGLPEFKFDIDEKGIIKSGEVVKRSLCGCTDYIVEHLIGVPASDAYERAGLLTQTYCKAPRGYEMLRGGSEIHISAQLHADAVSKALKKNPK